MTFDRNPAIGSGACDNTCAPGQVCAGTACCTPQAGCQPGQCGTVGDGCGGTLEGGACAALCGGACCGGGHECVHGGCFQVSTGFNCQDCPKYCNALCGTVDGSGNTLCISVTNASCDSTADCPVGQACAPGEEINYCAAPC